MQQRAKASVLQFIGYLNNYNYRHAVSTVS